MVSRWCPSVPCRADQAAAAPAAATPQGRGVRSASPACQRTADKLPARKFQSRAAAAGTSFSRASASNARARTASSGSASPERSTQTSPGRQTIGAVSASDKKGRDPIHRGRGRSAAPCPARGLIWTVQGASLPPISTGNFLSRRMPRPTAKDRPPSSRAVPLTAPVTVSTRTTPLPWGGARKNTSLAPSSRMAFSFPAMAGRSAASTGVFTSSTGQVDRPAV